MSEWRKCLDYPDFEVSDDGRGWSTATMSTNNGSDDGRELCRCIRDHRELGVTSVHLCEHGVGQSSRVDVVVEVAEEVKRSDDQQHDGQGKIEHARTGLPRSAHRCGRLGGLLV